MSSSRPQVPPIPEKIVDNREKQTYLVGRLLGKGGFARVHKFNPIVLRRDENGQVVQTKGPDVAGKVVAKVQKI